MRIRITANGLEYSGTPVQIVHAMQHGRFSMYPDSSLNDYIEQACKTLRDWYGVSLTVLGDTEEQRAASFIEAMLAHEVAEILPEPGAAS